MTLTGQSESPRTTPATAAEVLADVIAVARPRTIQELARPGRSGSTVTRAVMQLEAAQLLVKGDVRDLPADTPPQRGRPNVLVKVRPKLAIVGILVIDADQGPAKLVGSITDLTGRSRDDLPSVTTVVLDMEQRSSPRNMAGAIACLALELIEQAGTRVHVLGVGVGIGGHVRDGVVHRFASGHWSRFDLQGFLHKRLGRPVRVDNDTTALALQLAMHSETPNSSLAVICVFGNGIGGGLVLSGRVWRGSRGLPMEPGHVSVDSGLHPMLDPDGHVVEAPKCRCGSTGCVEAYAAPTRMLQHLRATDPQRPLTLEQAGDQPADQGASSTVFRVAGQALGRGISNIINTVDPSKVWVYAPSVLTRPARGSAAGEWQAGMLRAVEENDFGPRESAVDGRSVPWLRLIPATPSELEAMCARAAACLMTEAVLAQLDGTVVDDSARVDLETLRRTFSDGSAAVA